MKSLTLRSDKKAKTFESYYNLENSRLTILYNPKFMRKISKNEFSFILAHSMFHACILEFCNKE